MFNYKYPHTNLSDVNLDFAFKEINRISNEIKNISDDILNNAKAYTDSKLEAILAEFNGLLESYKASVNEAIRLFENETNIKIENISNDFSNLEADFDSLRDEVIAKADSAKAYTDQVISTFETYIKAYIASQVLDIQVVDYFTGNHTSIQNMLNKLAEFHVKSLTYSELATLNKTYNEVITIMKGGNYNLTYMITNLRTLMS